MSMKNAAADLCVTPAAVSKQIAKLESYLKTSLLIRGPQGLTLTASGAELLALASDGLDRIVRAMNDASEEGQQRPVQISASVGVTGLWLVPRLAQLQKCYPEVNVAISADNVVFPLRGSRFDLAIRYCAIHDTPAGAIHLFNETVAPVASPSMALRHQSPGEISRQVLLDLDDSKHPWLGWKSWLDSHSVAHGGAARTFNQYDQLIHAALAGQGVALGRLALLQEHLQDASLRVVGPAARDGTCMHAYWLLAAEDRPRVNVRCVADWICSQAASARQNVAEQLSEFPGG